MGLGGEESHRVKIYAFPQSMLPSVRCVVLPGLYVSVITETLSPVIMFDLLTTARLDLCRRRGEWEIDEHFYRYIDRFIDR